jgi:hypothetical protein
MPTMDKTIREFVAYAGTLDGDEKGEAQVFCDRLFLAFGWPGYKEAGARLEDRIHVTGKTAKSSKSCRFADLVWPGRLLLEMKSRGEKLEQHYQQAFEYWQHIVPHRPHYVVLCNFDEFWIYDFDLQLDDPVDRVTVNELPDRWTAFNFLLPEPKKPQFGNDRVAVTRDAADKVASLFNSLVQRSVERGQAQRFVLQCVVCLFAEDVGLLPRGFFTELIDDCRSGSSAYDLVGDLFRWMNNPKPAGGGRFKGVRYFNGGLFAVVEPIDLAKDELELLYSAAQEDWSKVNPAIFGTLFEGSMDKKERHALGAHFTSEADIQKVVLPTIVRPWRDRIAATQTLGSLLALRSELESFRVLDPACGSGNFLYVAYRELVRVEMTLVNRIRAEFPGTIDRKGAKRSLSVSAASFISIKQFHGIDINDFAVELAKVTLLVGKKLAYDEVTESLRTAQVGLALEDPLPLDNLEKNIIKADALFCDWPMADAIIGNPPYQSKNKMQREYGAAYVKRVRDRYPAVPGRADYCVYWFRRAHDHLKPGNRAGLVGTNTIRQNYSREGGLDHIVDNGGTITEAVSTQVWSGDAAVHVSIVNWVKGRAPGKKLLLWQEGDSRDSPWSRAVLDEIRPALSPKLDVTAARPLRANAASDACYQGQTHGHVGFLLEPEEVTEFIKASRLNANVLFPFLIGDDLLGRLDGSPSRWVIDFHPMDKHEAAEFKKPFEHVQSRVLPDRQRAAREEEERNAEVREANPHARGNAHHRNFLNQWWLLSWPRGELIAKLSELPRYVACVRTTKRPIFEFISTAVRPNDALQVFAVADDYSFGVLQSNVHWMWFVERCSTLKRDFRYTSDTVFDSFPWPQSASLAQVRKVARAAVALRGIRYKVMEAHGLTRRDLYRQLDSPGTSPVKEAHNVLDSAVREAYGMTPKKDPLAFLLELNLALAAREAQGTAIVGPGLPACVAERESFITTDCVQPAKV